MDDSGGQRLSEIEADRGHRRRESSAAPGAKRPTRLVKARIRWTSIRIDARRVEAEFRAVPITDVKMVQSVVEKFREKYGVKDVKKYYSKFDVAVLVRLG